MNTKDKCRTCKFDLSDDQGTLRTSDCPDYLDGKITNGCEKYQADKPTSLFLTQEEKLQKKKAKAEEKASHKSTYTYKPRRQRGSFPRLPIVAGVMAACIILSFFFFTEYKQTDTQTEPDTEEPSVGENITQIIEDLVPSFVLLVFIMAFMLMLLTIVDRVGRGGY